jgi:hypothetical protein
MPQQNQRQGELKHPEKVLGVTFVSDDQTPEVLQPGEQSLDFPSSSVSFQPTSILSRVLSVPTMWSDHLDAVEPKFCIEAVGVVGVITNQVPRGVGNNHL